jgi:cellulose synthase operon protein C
MPESSGDFYRGIRKAFLILMLLQIGGCSSPEERAQNYYQNAIKLLAVHQDAKAALELRNAVRLKRNLIAAWRVLAEIDEASRNWQAVVADLRTIVELDPVENSARLKLGKLLLLAGNSNEALELANAGIELDNRNADLHALKAAISYKFGNRADAIRQAQTSLELDPTNADALILLATERLAKGDAGGALSLFQEPAVVQAKNLEGNLGLQLLKIKLFGQTGDLQSAEAALRKLVELNPDEPGYRKLLVNFYVERGRIDDAEQEMRNLTAANSSDPGAVLDLVQFLYAIKRDTVAARQELNARIGAGGDVFAYQMALVNMDFSEGNIAVGKQLLESLINSGGSPENARTATITLAQMYLSSRNLDASEKLANEVLREDPHNISALKLRASLRLERTQLHAATTDLLEALNYQPRSTDLMMLLATAYERSGLIELADKQLADATKVSNWSVNIGLEYASFLQRRGSIARAEDVLNGLSKRWPNDIRVLSALAQVRLARQNWTGAQEIAEAIRQLDNSSGMADQILGSALVGRNKMDEAITAFQNAYSAAPNAAASMETLVAVLLKANRKDQATTFLRSALSRNPNDANALVLLGSIQLSSGSAEKALKSFSAAVTAQPKDSVGYRALAGYYLGQRNYDEAIKIVRSGIQLQPESIPLRMILAGALEKKADYEAAISEYESMLEKQPGNLILANNLASLLLDHRTDQSNLQKVQSLAALLRKSEIPQFKDTLGWASYRQGDFRSAVSLSEEAVAALPDQAAVRYHLGMSYIANSQLAKGYEQLNRALELAPDDELATKIRDQLKKNG